MSEQPTAKPVVFLGPSLGTDDAAKFLDADFRPPIRSGDLQGLARGTVVGIIDGVFDQTLAISPKEIRTAIQNGVRVFGSSSMGALRAAEVPRMVGVGRVFAMFRDHLIDSDDEVALVFDSETQRPLSEPLVNIRHAVERLRGPGTIDDETAARILRAAKKLFYPERVYPRILAEAGIRDRAVITQLASMLGIHDLKRDDAISLLELLERVRSGEHVEVATEDEDVDTGPAAGDGALIDGVEALAVMPADAPVLCWEYGEAVPFRELVLFLKMTGLFARHAGAALARYALEGNELEEYGGGDGGIVVDKMVIGLRAQWGWATSEESRVTLRDMGVGFEDLLERMGEEEAAQRKLKALAREESETFLRALRSELLMSDLALKREAARCGSLAVLGRAGEADGPLRHEELLAARIKLSERVDAATWPIAKKELAEWGVADADADAFASMLAFARRTTQPRKRSKTSAKTAKTAKTAKGLRLVLRRNLKVAGDRRFCVPLRKALAYAKRLQKVVGITRLSVITGLSAMGVPNAQAYRPDGRFSSTIGSGKSFTVDGAKVGAVMEEVEKWAQERPSRDVDGEVFATYAALAKKRAPVLDPRQLDLPHDSIYEPSLLIGWRRCHDLITGALTYVPSSALTPYRARADIFWSARLAQKMFTTNGLASAFTLEEALTHGLSELVERHAQKLAEIRIAHPGVVGEHGYRFIDPETLPASSQALRRKIEAAGHLLRVLETTSEVEVPTFFAQILIPLVVDDTTYVPRFGHAWQVRPGYATHPDPEVAVNGAILEATQSVMTNIAGGREDLTIKSRSLGRHERSAAMSRAGIAFLRDPSIRATKSFADVRGAMVSRDAREDVLYLLKQIARAGVDHVFAVDLSRDEIRPARVVRVLAPGLETPSSLAHGPRARAALLGDLLPPR